MDSSLESGGIKGHRTFPPRWDVDRDSLTSMDESKRDQGLERQMRHPKPETEFVEMWKKSTTVLPTTSRSE